MSLTDGLQVHDNEGNARNLMFDLENGSLVAIDTAFTAIRALNSYSQGLRDRYLERLRRFLTAVLGGDETKTIEALAPARTFIMNETGHDVGVEGCLAMARGVAAGARRVATLTPEVLSVMKERVRGMVRVDWEDVWKKGIEMIDLDFLRAVLGVFRDVVAIHHPPVDTPAVTGQDTEGSDDLPQCPCPRDPGTGSAGRSHV
jgi:hypothetical protein